jgi:hypothetical protein
MFLGTGHTFVVLSNYSRGREPVVNKLASLILEIKEPSESTRNSKNTTRRRRKYLDDLSVFFDDRVVAIAPNGGRMEGREAMVESFRQFLAMARVDDFRVTGVGVDVFDSTAVVPGAQETLQALSRHRTGEMR